MMGAISAPAQEKSLIIWHPAGTPPTGYIKANGAVISRTAYAWLFSRIGTTFGAGDGSTTFAVPDLRGEFLRGLDDGRGIDPGRSIGTAQGDALQGHWHEIWRNTSINPTGGTMHGSTGSPNTNLSGTDMVRAPISDGSNGTPRTASETRARNIAGLYCIAYAP